MSPKTKEQYEEIRRKSRQTIREVALELFARYGFHRTSISEIAKAAGVSKGLMYNYFESKEALLHDIIFQAVETGEELMNEQFGATTDARGQLRGLTEATVRMLRDNYQYWKLLTALSLQPEVLTGLESFMEQKRRETMALMTDLFRRLGAEDPEREAYYYGAVLDGVMLHYMQLGEKYDLDGMMAHIHKRFNLD